MRLLDNIVWHCLAGPHTSYSRGTERARRYAPGFSPIVGFANAERPDFDALVPYCDPGEHFYCGAWSGLAPTRWRVDVDSAAHQMVWDAPLPAIDESLDAVPLGSGHVAQMLALATLTQPGPFAPRTGELGEYFGVFEDGRLVAMAGERLAAGSLREVSGVCTHPQFQGRGFARRLVAKVVRRQLERRQIPFLHVMQDNHHARRLYERMGFRHHQEFVVRVVSRAE